MTKTDESTCQDHIVHNAIVAGVQKQLSERDTLREMAQMFKTMSDPTRLTIINALLLSEMCVCDIAELLQMTQPAVSHHLRELRQMKLIKYRREGKSAYYSLDDEHIGLLFNLCKTHVMED